MLIKDILVQGLKTIAIDATMSEAQKLMQEFSIRHLPVSDGKKIVGIISDRDILLATTKISQSDSTDEFMIQKHKKVSEYMKSPVFKLSHNTLLKTLVREMLERKVSSVIIEDDRHNDIGIMTTDDLLFYLLNHLDSKVSTLQKFKKIFKQ